MPSLKELKLRINSVKSTKKITKVMKMVAAAKLKKAQKRSSDAQPYASAIKELLQKVKSSVPSHDLPALLENTENKIHLLFVVASDKGLCGGYNTAIIKLVKEYIINLDDECQVKIVCIGSKAQALLKRNHGESIIHVVEKIQVTYDDVSVLMNKVIANEHFDVAKIFYTKFVSSISQVPTIEQIAPFDSDDNESYECECEPDQMTILSSLIIDNLSAQLYRAIADSQASEYMLRMLAMDSATRNADDMIRRLTLYYNRSRQAAITKELIEIISGAEAL